MRVLIFTKLIKLNNKTLFEETNLPNTMGQVKVFLIPKNEDLKTLKSWKQFDYYVTTTRNCLKATRKIQRQLKKKQRSTK